MDEITDPLRLAVMDGDIAALRRLVAEGADLNRRDEYGDPFLFDALFMSSPYDEESQADGERYGVISALMDFGADPCQLAEDGASVLIGPALSLDTAMVDLLLARGVDPNRGCCEPSETVYDAAFFDYQFEAWMKVGEPAPEPPDDLNMADEDALLRFLDQDAVARGKLRPEILMLLRKHGALSNREMAMKLGGDPDARIEWRGDEWRLAPPVAADPAP